MKKNEFLRSRPRISMACNAHSSQEVARKHVSKVYGKASRKGWKLDLLPG